MRDQDQNDAAPMSDDEGRPSVASPPGGYASRSEPNASARMASGAFAGSRWNAFDDMPRARLQEARPQREQAAPLAGLPTSASAQAFVRLHALCRREHTQRRRLESELVSLRAELASARRELDGTRAGELRARHLAEHDSLTALPNRRWFREQLDLALGVPQAVLAVLFLDLDGFKPINDVHGHAAGDELLRIVAARLSLAVRSEDRICRIGGDEFACMLVGHLNRAQLGLLARKLIDAVSAPMRLAALQLNVRPSIGIALSPDDGSEAEELLARADHAMYRAKREGAGYAFCDRRGV
jgi:diguanylate cyclase (GGDEF)-like protein